MTTEGFREVDDDLLADYLGGALDGTPQQAEIDRLVSTDPAWADAYALLTPAVTEVRADLARWAEPAPEMPPAIVDRLAAALAGAKSTNDTATADQDPAATPRVDMAGVDMAGVDMAGVDMAGVDMAGVDMAGVDMAGETTPSLVVPVQGGAGRRP
ncbi:hypothetical protein JM949_26120, partial [Micromonospora sp. STR1s_6]|nr:hypothetical protein [Micromonospora tarensis]